MVAAPDLRDLAQSLVDAMGPDIDRPEVYRAWDALRLALLRDARATPIASENDRAGKGTP